MHKTQIIDFIGEYCLSEQYFFIDSLIKEYTEPVLEHWCKNVGDEINFASIKKSLNSLSRLELPLEIKNKIPSLLKDFFSWLSTTGKYPQAKEWESDIILLEKQYYEGFRKDGSVKGETFKKRYTDTGRNDPCPCGSGQKFKKCCMPLISK